MSYCGHLDFGIVADREQMPDVWSLMGWLREALDELRPLGRRGRMETHGDERRRRARSPRPDGGSQMAEQFCDVGRGITLCYEEFGDPERPADAADHGAGDPDDRLAR